MSEFSFTTTGFFSGFLGEENFESVSFGCAARLAVAKNAICTLWGKGRCASVTSVNVGDVFGLLGSNGAGKTTTIKTLTTLLPPSSGDALVAGLSIKRQSVGVRRAIGYVPQAVSVDSSLTGYENLLIFAKLYDIPGVDRTKRIQETLEFMGLSSDSGRLVNEYSGGMVRRLEIALSTLHRPKVLFLDEPTVGLDPIARDAVWKLLMDLRDNFGPT